MPIMPTIKIGPVDPQIIHPQIIDPVDPQIIAVPTIEAGPVDPQEQRAYHAEHIVQVAAVALGVLHAVAVCICV